MKQRIFTLLMMLALVFVAGSAMAVIHSTVIQGGKYPYNLNGIVMNNAAGGTGTISCPAGTISNVTGWTGSSPYTVPTGSSTLTFDMTFNTVGNTSITVVVTDGSCSNQIVLAVTVTDAPTIDLSFAAVTSPVCQAALGSTNNLAASSGQTNTLTFTISKATTNDPTSYSWGYTIAISNDGLGSFVTKRNGVNASPGAISNVASTATEVWTVEYATTTGIDPADIVATISNAKITDLGTGAATYDETDLTDNQATIVVSSMPSIGAFN